MVEDWLGSGGTKIVRVVGMDRSEELDVDSVGLTKLDFRSADRAALRYGSKNGEEEGDVDIAADGKTPPSVTGALLSAG